MGEFEMEENEMLDFVKALSDADRLRIIGMLTQHPASTKEIAAELGLSFKDTNNHLAFMKFAGILREEEDVYKLNPEGLEALSRRQFAGKPRETYTPAPDLQAETRKVLKTCLNPDGSIKQIPQQPARLRVILDYIIAAFTPGTTYTEKEVNMIIKRFNPDVSGLRRDLVDAGMLKRERDGSKYWREAPHD
jgi:hypothetical protein